MSEQHQRVLGRSEPPPAPANAIVVVVASAVGAVAGLVFGASLLTRGPVEVTGGALAVGLAALAFAVRRYFAAAFPAVESAEPRTIGSAPPGADGPIADVSAVPRRSLVLRVLVGATGLFALSLLAPVSALGPRRQGVQDRTAWGPGIRVVTIDGRPLRPEDVPEGGLNTVFPEGAEHAETAAVVLVRLAAPPLRPTNLDWVVNGSLVAYSKVCTHVGCPVGLLRQREAALFCPCHQQSFDAARAATPTFGPAARPLPQLPLGVDADGYLVALDDFTQPVGPAVG